MSSIHTVELLNLKAIVEQINKRQTEYNLMVFEKRVNGEAMHRCGGHNMENVRAEIYGESLST